MRFLLFLALLLSPGLLLSQTDFSQSEVEDLQGYIKDCTQRYAQLQDQQKKLEKQIVHMQNQLNLIIQGSSDEFSRKQLSNQLKMLKNKYGRLQRSLDNDQYWLAQEIKESQYLSEPDKRVLEQKIIR